MEQIDALRAMLADATPGEWVYMPPPERETYASLVCDNGRKLFAYSPKADAALIAAMHNALPALLDAVEMVEAVKTYCDKHIQTLKGVQNKWKDRQMWVQVEEIAQRISELQLVLSVFNREREVETT